MNDFISILLLILRVGLALSLYAFLTLALYTIWQSVQTQAKQLEQRKIPPLTLLPVNSPELPAELNFSYPNIFIGRDPECEVVVQNPTISATHAKIYYSHTQWWIEDLESRNGTLLNGIPVETPTVLTAQDELQFGEILFKIRMSN